MGTPETLFNVDVSTVEAMFSGTQRGFYVPPYQRQYSWGREEIDRLVEDLCIGLQAWLDDPDIVTFLGSIILIKDELFEQVEPAIKEHLPGEVMVVIDGQQRLSTLSLFGVVLHDEIVRRGAKIKKKSFPGSDWLSNRFEQAAYRLLPLFQLDVGFGESPLYPKIVRAYHDQWSREASTARYQSPIAKFLAGYVSHFQSKATKAYKSNSDDPGDKSVTVVARRIASHLKKIALGEGTEGDPIFPLDQHFPEDAQKHLFKDKIPSEFEEYLKSCDDKKPLELMNLIALANYLLTRCAVTLTRPMEDRFAFDLFERLNTTGQQLTAYETFRPLVVRAEGLVKYRDSDAHKWIVDIDAFLPMDLPYEKRTRITNDLLLPFAMGQEGKRLAKRLGQQRNWLRTTFENLKNLEQKRVFLCEMRNLARFLEEAFLYNSQVTTNTHIQGLELENEGRVVLCLDFLRRAKNEICVGPLSRFYSEAILNPSKDKSMSFACTFAIISSIWACTLSAFITFPVSCIVLIANI